MNAGKLKPTLVHFIRREKVRIYSSWYNDDPSVVHTLDYSSLYFRQVNRVPNNLNFRKRQRHTSFELVASDHGFVSAKLTVRNGWKAWICFRSVQIYTLPGHTHRDRHHPGDRLSSFGLLGRSKSLGMIDDGVPAQSISDPSRPAIESSVPVQVESGESGVCASD